jgi:hypothetical protein
VTNSRPDSSRLEPARPRNPYRALSCVSVLTMMASACSSDSPSHAAPHARPDQIPPSISLSAASYAFGFASGRTSTPVSVTAFAITKTPITVGQYRQCVAARACAKPALDTPSCREPRVPVVEGTTYDPDGAADGLPVTCVMPLEAAHYCEWVGGSLPTIEQWVYAARGEEIQEFSWGRTLPDCTKHQRATPAGRCCPRDGCDPTTYFSVAQHPDVSSPTGLLDVLLTPGELVRSHSGSALAACSAASGACVARGVLPGAIDGAFPVSYDMKTEAFADAGGAFGFRCAFEVKP